jgi:ribosomal protein L33
MQNIAEEKFIKEVVGVSVGVSATAYVPPGNASSPEPTPPGPVISIAGNEVTLATNAYITKNERQLRMIIAKYDKVVEKHLRQFLHKPVRVYVPDMGVAFTAVINERKNDHSLFVRIPSNLKRFFMPLWQSNAMFLVYITIDAKLLQLDQETRKTTNLKDGLKSLGGDAPASLGSNRGAQGAGGQPPSSQGEGEKVWQGT